MFRFLIVQNRKGATRLEKFWVAFEAAQKKRVKALIHQLLSARDETHSNFLMVDEFECKLVFRRYQQLYFIMGVDRGENEVATLEAIHLLVEVLDNYFGNVSELDLIYNFHKALLVVDEVFMAGELMETSKNVILKQLSVLDQLS